MTSDLGLATCRAWLDRGEGRALGRRRAPMCLHGNSRASIKKHISNLVVHFRVARNLLQLQIELP